MRSKVKELLEYIGTGILICVIAAVTISILFCIAMFVRWLLRVLAFPIVVGILILLGGTIIGVVGFVAQEIRSR